MDIIKGLVAGAKGAAERAAESVGNVAGNLAEAMPSGGTVKRGIGQALILGGRVLLDPRAVVGELAIECGQKLSGGETDDRWLTLEATDSGFAVLTKGSEESARAVLDAAAREGRSVILCKVMAAPTSVSTP